MEHWIAVHLFMVVSKMKKFILHILLFFSIVTVVDVTAGFAFKHLQSIAGGGTGAEYYVCREGSEEVLVMGSSRASHHYVSRVLADSLGMTCYNGGQDGNGIVMQYGRWKMISKRHVPKVIIYDIEPAFDLFMNDNYRYIDRLKPYADDREVNGYVAGLFPMERLKMMSKMYCFNYKFLEVMSDCARSRDSNGGYKPNFKHIRQEVIDAKPTVRRYEYNEADEVKMQWLENLIEEAKKMGVKVVLISSPYWRGYPEIDLHLVKNLADKLNVPFIDYANSEIRNNPDWWADSMHLNDEGAQFFSSDLSKKLRELI